MIDRERTGDVLVAYCHNGGVANVFMESLIRAFSGVAPEKQRERIGDYIQAQGPYIHSSRNRIVEFMLAKTDFQWLWFLDNDVEFPPDALLRLLDAAEEHGIQVLAGAYWNQYARSGCYLSWLIAQEDGYRPIGTLPDVIEPVAVSAVGMGCTLIHRDVLETLQDQYPGDPWAWFAADVLRYDDNTAVRLGEDVSFCGRATRAGFPVFGLPTLVCDHYKAVFLPHGSPDVAGPLVAGGGSEEDVSIIGSDAKAGSLAHTDRGAL